VLLHALLVFRRAHVERATAGYDARQGVELVVGGLILWAELDGQERLGHFFVLQRCPRPVCKS